MAHMEFASRLKQQREQYGKTVEIFATDIGITTSRVKILENGVLPTCDLLMKIADYFGVSTDYLLGRAEV